MCLCVQNIVCVCVCACVCVCVCLCVRACVHLRVCVQPEKIRAQQEKEKLITNNFAVGKGAVGFAMCKFEVSSD